MILKYGNYAHALGEATIVIGVQPLFNEQGTRYAERERWEISGFLQASTTTALTAAINAMKAAYALPNQELGLYLGDGHTLSSHYIRPSDTLAGIRVISGPNFPQGRGAEYSTFRSYQIVLEADRPVDESAHDPDATLLAWEETLTFTGGGPRFVYLQTLLGLPQKQIVAAATPFRVTQQGRAVGQSLYPPPATPLWPIAEHVDDRKLTRKSPRASTPAGGPTEYEVTWQYVFESESPLVGNPTIR
jgi:hypothetical protein